MKTELKDAIENRHNLVCDQTNLGVKKRKSILAKLPDTYFKVAVVFNIDDKELDRRLKERAEKDGKRIPPNVMKNMCSSYNPVTKEEGFDKIIEVR